METTWLVLLFASTSCTTRWSSSSFSKMFAADVSCKYSPRSGFLFRKKGAPMAEFSASVDAVGNRMGSVWQQILFFTQRKSRTSWYAVRDSVLSVESRGLARLEWITRRGDERCGLISLASFIKRDIPSASTFEQKQKASYKDHKACGFRLRLRKKLAIYCNEPLLSGLFDVPAPEQQKTTCALDRPILLVLTDMVPAVSFDIITNRLDCKSLKEWVRFFYFFTPWLLPAILIWLRCLLLLWANDAVNRPYPEESVFFPT